MRIFVAILFFTCMLFAKENILLLKKYQDQNVSGWLMSEKLDGIRAIWDGKHLYSRKGKIFYPPKWFTKEFPPFKIDGELWRKRGDFENIQSIVMDKTPTKKWQEISYNIFEVPNQKGGLNERLLVLKEYLKKHPNTLIRVIPQTTCKSKKHLEQFLKNIIEKGGEGVVVRDPNAPYISKRTNRALKVKRFDDTECKIVKLHKGKGKYKNLLGSFTCKMGNGVVFKIGSGLKNRHRKNFLKVGDEVTFKYQGFTKNGKPRFPIFLHVRK